MAIQYRFRFKLFVANTACGYFVYLLQDKIKPEKVERIQYNVNIQYTPYLL